MDVYSSENRTRRWTGNKGAERNNEPIPPLYFRVFIKLDCNDIWCLELLMIIFGK